VDFFDAQDSARRSTRWLVVAYFAAALLIIAGVTALVGASLYMVGDARTPPPLSVLVATAVLAALLIGGATLYKTAALAAGGARVAAGMGGTLVPSDVQDPLRRRLRNVVEEMAIASGIPAPDVYVLESEPGINAFAAERSLRWEPRKPAAPVINTRILRILRWAKVFALSIGFRITGAF
jgi:Zn-dependent protease with chaperone function